LLAKKFKVSIDDQLTNWANLRQSIETSNDPFTEVWDYWQGAPYIPYNKNVDPYNQRDWPTPWEILVDNQYDDFTKTLMIGWTLKLTKRFSNSCIEVRTMVDKVRNLAYNIVSVDRTWAINYSDNGPVKLENIPNSFYLENLVELETPR
jgi:hypothetical protein